MDYAYKPYQSEWSLYVSAVTVYLSGIGGLPIAPTCS